MVGQIRWHQGHKSYKQSVPLKELTAGLYWNDFDYNDIGFAKYPPKTKNIIRKIIFVLMIRNTLNLAPNTDQKLMSVFEDLHSCLKINGFLTIFGKIDPSAIA